jgi:hypothetical protein
MVPVLWQLAKTVRRPRFIVRYPEFCIAFIMMVSLLVAAWSESFMFAVGSTEGFTFWFLLAWLRAYIQNMDGYFKNEGEQMHG